MTVVDVAKRVAGENPFLGLRPFGVEQADLFFGRDALTAKLMQQLATNRFLAVVGASGSGKSSLVSAGMVARLQSDSAAVRWRIATTRPGLAPVEALAESLSDPRILGSAGDDPAIQRAAIRHSLDRGYLGLVDLVYQARFDPDERLIVIVDQFEELFRFRAGADQAGVTGEGAAFVKLLLTAAHWTDVPIHVVATMRSDYLGDCARFPDLTEGIHEGLMLVPRMTRDELQTAIEGPVNRVEGAAITPQLVSIILNDVGNLSNEMDQLPVLQHALMRTWDYWRDHHAAAEPLDVVHYEQIGQVSGALEKHAEAVYNALDDEQKIIAQRTFRCVTARDAEGRSVSRPTPFATACAITGATSTDLTAVLERFNGPGVSFLTPPPPPPYDHAVLDLTHESLIRLWDCLAGWVDKEAQAAETYATLVADAAADRKGWVWTDPQLALGLSRLSAADATINAAWAERYDAGLEKRVAELERQRAAPAGTEATGADGTAGSDLPLYAQTARERFAAAMKFLDDSADAPRKARLQEEESRRAALDKEVRERRAAADAENDKRRIKSYALAIGLLLVAVIASVTVALFARQERRQAVDAEKKAVQAQQVAAQKMAEYRARYVVADATSALNAAYLKHSEKDNEKAVPEFTKAIAGFGKQPGTTQKLADAYEYRGLSYDDMDQHEKALKDYKKAIELYATLPHDTGIAGSAAAYNSRCGTYILMARTLETGSVSADTKKRIKELYQLAANDAGRAIEFYAKAGSADLASNAYFNRGLARQESDPPDHRGARADLSHAIMLFENAGQMADAGDGNKARAYSRLALNDEAGALADFTLAIKRKEVTDLSDAYTGRAAINIARGDRRSKARDYEGAIGFYRAAIRDYLRAAENDSSPGIKQKLKAARAAVAEARKHASTVPLPQ